MTFAEEFARNQGKVIEVDGRPVCPMFRYQVHPGDHVRVIRRRSVDRPLQGIRIKLLSGTFAIDGKALTDAVLWRDTAPDELVIVCNVKRATELRIWNCWRDDCGVMQAWIGNAGMRVEQMTDDRVTIECNCRPEITFADLVFDLIFERMESRQREDPSSNDSRKYEQKP